MFKNISFCVDEYVNPRADLYINICKIYIYICIYISMHVYPHVVQPALFFCRLPQGWGCGLWGTGMARSYLPRVGLASEGYELWCLLLGSEIQSMFFFAGAWHVAMLAITEGHTSASMNTWADVLSTTKGFRP